MPAMDMGLLLGMKKFCNQVAKMAAQHHELLQCH